jgi:Holliday junction DNA helicase RuvA
MISKIYGEIKSISSNSITIFIGFCELDCFVARIDRFSLAQNVALEVFMSWNSDSGPTLFGFIDKAEKDMFSLICTCSGIGPKMAISLLSTIDIFVIKDAVINNKPKVLSQAPGIGIKKAEMIILELKDKINKIKLSISEENKCNFIYDDLIDALKHLGYEGKDIGRVINEISKDNSLKDLPFHQLIRVSLEKI